VIFTSSPIDIIESEPGEADHTSLYVYNATMHFGLRSTAFLYAMCNQKSICAGRYNAPRAASYYFSRLPNDEVQQAACWPG
jgi:hypothetical protein